jgi:hypothetical protein
MDAVFGRVAGASGAIEPDRELAGRVEALLRYLARAGHDAGRAGPLGVMTWLAWWRGHGSLAWELVDRTLEADPGHSLARLVRTALERLMPPPWAAARRQRAAAEGEATASGS